MPYIESLFIKAAPNLILAGDICYYRHPNFEKFFQKISQIYNFIIYVPGNHEYYAGNDYIDQSFDAVDYEIKLSLEKYRNIVVLQKEYIELNNILIFGTTLWCKTDKRDLTYEYVKLTNDNYYNKNGHNKPYPSLDYIATVNNNQYTWLNNVIGNIKTRKKIIVITHYLPTSKCIDKQWENDPENDLFFTNCEHLFEKVDFWIAGHTHNNCILNEKNCEIIVNPIGKVGENQDYIRGLYIDVFKSFL